jgi:hypothetical protein
MKVSALLLIITITSSSCSSFNQSANSTIMYGGLGGAVVGAGAGYAFSPDRDSDVFNSVLWGAVGAFIGAGIGYLLRSDDPDNREMKQMIRSEKGINDIKPLNEDFGFQLIKPTESRSYIVPDQKIPDRLKGLVKKQIITEHIISERVEKKESGKTIVYPETKVYEYDFE